MKLPTVITLVRISVLPILFYAAPVWMKGNEDGVKRLWQDVLKTATGTTHYKPNTAKMEIISSNFHH